MRFLLALLTISAMRVFLLPVIVVTFILAGIVFCSFFVFGPILFGLIYLILGKKISIKLLRTEDNYCQNGADLVISGCIYWAEKSVRCPAKMFGVILEKLQDLQDKLAKA